MTDTELDDLLGRPLVAVIGTVDASGRPRCAPIWLRWRGLHVHVAQHIEVAKPGKKSTRFIMRRLAGAAVPLGRHGRACRRGP